MEVMAPNPLEEFIGARRRRTFLALALALVVHLAVILMLPERVLPVHRTANKQAEVVYEIDLVEPENMRFVEANPEAPENEPDRSDQYSYRAQQAADESPEATADNAPKVAGEEDSQKILQGQLEQAPPVPPGVYSPQAQPGEGEGSEGGEAGAQTSAQVEPPQPLPPPDFIEQKPVNESGPGSRLEQTADAPEEVPELDPNAPIDVYRPPDTEQAQADSGDGSGGAPEARPTPRARPRLAPELLSGPLMQSNSSASRRGELAIDATFSEFGEYQQQFYAAVQAGWYQEIEFFEPIDTAARVHVRFRMQADGTVDRIEAVQSTASKLATVICETAISKRSPFRPWTEEMVRVFGDERWLNVVFHYR
ncbi:MAG: hypothetical protein ACLFU4_05315 [Opitutales bacterium]